MEIDLAGDTSLQSPLINHIIRGCIIAIIGKNSPAPFTYKNNADSAIYCRISVRFSKQWNQQEFVLAMELNQNRQKWLRVFFFTLNV